MKLDPPLADMSLGSQTWLADLLKYIFSQIREGFLREISWREVRGSIFDSQSPIQKYRVRVLPTFYSAEKSCRRPFVAVSRRRLHWSQSQGYLKFGQPAGPSDSGAFLARRLSGAFRALTRSRHRGCERFLRSLGGVSLLLWKLLRNFRGALLRRSTDVL